jgi:hypothetical protein
VSAGAHAAVAAAGLVLAGLGGWAWARYGLDVWIDALVAFCT